MSLLPTVASILKGEPDILRYLCMVLKELFRLLERKRSFPLVFLASFQFAWSVVFPRHANVLQ